MKHTTSALDQRTAEMIRSMISADESLRLQGIVLTGSDGGIYSIVQHYESIGNKKTSGALSYLLWPAHNEFRICAIKNRPEVSWDMIFEEFVPYHSEQQRAIGRDNLFNSALELSKLVDAESIQINTWIIPARPQLLDNPASFFYGFAPDNPASHEHMVRKFRMNPVQRLRDYEFRNKIDTVNYHKVLR